MHTRKKHPDGQIDAQLDSWRNGEHIVERIGSYEDLMYVRSLVEAMRSNGVRDITLDIPCLFGQRSDRRFEVNQSFALKLIAQDINSCNFRNVRIFDPHSDVSLALINNSVKRSSYDIVRQIVLTMNQADLALVSPDAGAYKKIFDYGGKLRLPIIAGNKNRDREGNITLNISGNITGKNCFIVDDLCSRGGTFIGLANQLKEQGAKKVYLYVSHFEGGCEEYKQTIDNLLKVIDGVYTTNSFREFDVEDLEKINVTNIV
jgi:ribose-phosphate pyrophosphokinase